MKLTDTFVKRKQGNGKAQKYADGGGLFLYISPKGTKSWRLAYRYLGKHKLLVIGPYPAISLKEARERREAAKKLLVDNIDPSAAKREAKAVAENAAKNTFEAVAREWIEKFAGSWTPHTQRHILRRMENFIFPVMGKRPINSISAPELLTVLRKIESKGFLCVAHLARSECGRVFRYAIATDRAERDVAHDLTGALPPMPAPKHLAAITDTRVIGKFLDTLDSNYGMFHIRCALRLAPFVFVRAKELTEAEWSHFDLDAAEWRIPAEVMKMRQPHIVPLSRQAMAILRELHPVTGNGRFLFPGKPKKGKGGKLAAIGGEVPIRNKTLVQSLRNLGYTKDEMTFHGFRSMASTVLNEKGYNRDWIERQLAHTERDEVRAAYNYAEYLPERRKMMQEWADYITELKEKVRKNAAAPSTAPA
jgi:integrase